MSRAIHRNAGLHRVISAALVIAFALSVTSISIAFSGDGAGETSVALAHGNGHGNGHDRAHEARASGDTDCACGCDECRDGEHCDECVEVAAEPTGGASDDSDAGTAGGADDAGQACESDESGDTGSDSGKSDTSAVAQAAPTAAVAPEVTAAAAVTPESVSTAPSTIPASGQGIVPVLVTHTNPGCPVGTLSYKIDATPSNGTYALPGGGSITISNATDYGFDFTTSGVEVLEAIVKASDDANIYDYTSLGGVTWDTGLLSVAKPDGGFYRISHASFCYEKSEETYEINGVKWEDTNGDGLWSNGVEPLLPGWTIQLSKKADDGSWQLYAETVTGVGGYYEFTGLPAGEYKVEEVQQPGHVQTFGGCEFTLGGVSASGVLSPDGGGAEPGCFDFGNMPYEIGIHGYKFFDRNGDADWGDGEEGLSGWTIQLYEKSESTWVLVGSTETGDGGYYEFVGLEPGEYYLVEVIPGDPDADWYQTYGSTGSSDSFVLDWGDDRRSDFGNTHDHEYTKTWELTLINDHESPAGVTYFVTFDLNDEASREDLELLPGTSDPMMYAAETPVACGDEISNVEWWASWLGEDIKLGEGVGIEMVEGDLVNPFRFEPIVFGHKFSDHDADGFWDDGEAALPGWEIVLVRVMEDGSQEEYGRAFTDEEGYYEFQAVLPGEYWVYEVEQDGWRQTAGFEGTFTVENPDEEGPFDFGNARLGRIYGYKYADLAPNGVLGDEDFVLEDWTIQLFKSVDDQWVFIDDTTTDADGLFAFEELLPGRYYVVEVQQDGWTQTSGPVGPGDAVTLVPGGDVGPVDFLNAPPDLPLSPFIFGHKYRDADDDGKHDSGEEGLAGWTIELYFNDGGTWDKIATTVTGDDGYFEFRALPDGSALPNGEYYLIEVIADDSPWHQTFGPTGPEDSFVVNDAVEVDYGPFDFGNATDGPPYLPFTGGSPIAIAIAALAAAVLGVLLRRLGGVAQG